MKLWNSNREIDSMQPCYIIAEAGSNHDRDFSRAKELIEVAAEAGADAVKFQLFNADKIAAHYVDDRTAINDNFAQYGTSVHDLFKKIELPPDWIPNLKDYADKRKIDFLATAFDEVSLDFIDSCGVVAHKIASFELVHIPLLRHAAEKGKPIILSTGMASLGDIEIAIKNIQGYNNVPIALLHCSIGYPPPFNAINLKAMHTLALAFGCPVGYSDHTLGLAVPFAAVGMGASIIEKHFTLSKEGNGGPDHQFALRPYELKQMVDGIREVEAAIGSGAKKRFPNEEIHYIRGRRSVFASRSLKKGDILTDEAIAVLRPGVGISPHFIEIIIGKSIKKDIEKDSPILWEHLL